MARSLKDWIGDSADSSNSQSLIARVGGFGQQYTDPLYWIFGDKYTDKLIGLADKSNDFLSKSIFKPIGKYAGQFDPIRQNVKEADQVGDWGEAKPVDTLALLAGAYFGGGAALGGGSGASGGAGGAGLGTGASTPSLAGFMPGSAASGAAGLEGVTVVGSSGAAMTPGTAAALGAAGAAPAAQSNGYDWRKLMENMPQQQGQQQQQPAPQQSVGARPQSMVERMKRGLGATGERMFPIDQAYGLDQQQQQAMRKNAMLQMGLGMMAAGQNGAGLGEAMFGGFRGAQNTMQGALQRGYENAIQNRQEQRQVERDKVSDDRFNTEMDYRFEAMRESRENRETDRAYKIAQDELEQKRWETARADDLSWRQAQIDGVTRNPEVRVTDRGMFERDPKTREWKLVPGTEPTGVSGRPIPQGMANDLKTNASVMNQIDQLLPQLRDESGAFTNEAKDAFGAGNAWVNMLTPDALSDNAKNLIDSDGANMRAIVTNLNSYVVKERNGAAVTVAEFARQRGFLPTDTDDEAIVEKKLTQLRKAIADEQQYMLDFAESQGYRPPPGEMKPSAAPAGGKWQIEPL